LVDFAGQMLAGLPRADQQSKGELYLRGLLTDGRRKSMQPMAERLGVDHQQLQQFITSSTWDYERVRGNVARWGSGYLDPQAYAVDDTGFAKDGTASPCVARQYSGTLGKTGNCQIGVSVQMVTDTASLAANWRLFCPKSWDDTSLDDPAAAERARRRRERAKIPDRVRHREKWRLALDMLDQMTGQWRLPKLPVSATPATAMPPSSGWGSTSATSTMCWKSTPPPPPYPADVQPFTPEYSGRGRRPVPGYEAKPSTLKELF
jgi:hypothetical protein